MIGYLGWIHRNRMMGRALLVRVTAASKLCQFICKSASARIAMLDPKMTEERLVQEPGNCF
jgi:aspartyl-tRNA synthetase